MGSNAPPHMGSTTAAGVPAPPASLLQAHQLLAGQPPAALLGVQANKKQREVYVGNLAQGIVTAVMLRDFFSQILTALPGFDPLLGPPILNVQLSGEGKYAFIEMRDEVLAATMIKLDKIELCGRLVNVGRPSGYVEMSLVTPLDLGNFAPPQGAGAGQVAGASNGPTDPAMQATRKQRELYVGNLAIGAVTAQMLQELFSTPLQAMPGFDAAKGPPVRNVDMSGEGKFAFVELRDEELANVALELFNNMDLCGRKLHIGRPRGYVDPNVAAPGLGLGGVLPMAPALPAAALPGLPQNSALALTGLTAAGAVGEAAGAALQASPIAPSPALVGTPFLQLVNLVDEDVLKDDDEYRDIVADIRNECMKSGQVLELKVPRPGTSEAAAQFVGRAFVRFADLGASRAAQVSLDGRQFDGNTVKATFMTADEYTAVPANS